MTEDQSSQKALIHKVEHFKQRYNWDCGVSCVLMLLGDQEREEFLENFTDICDEEGFGHSTWTIDLCFLLKRYNIKHCMYTAMAGVNQDYKKHSYYNHIINQDSDRVRQKFDNAPSQGIEVIERAVTMEEIVKHLKEHGPVIILVDAGLLVCDLCKYNKLKFEFRRCFGGGYKGHYILAVGERSGRILYRDVGLSRRICAATVARLNDARLANGTDADVIFVYKSYL